MLCLPHTPPKVHFSLCKVKHLFPEVSWVFLLVPDKTVLRQGATVAPGLLPCNLELQDNYLYIDFNYNGLMQL